MDSSENEINISLPNDVNQLDEIKIIDIKKTFHINNIILHGNGRKIEKSINSFTMDINGGFVLTYVDMDYGWSIN